MRVLVIGGTGFLGPHLVRRLHRMGHEVTVFHRGATEAELPPGVRHLHHPSAALGDRRHFATWSGTFRRLALDIVLDMIAFTEADARALVAAFRGVAGRVVVLSSQDVYRAYGRALGAEGGPPDPVPLPEEAPLRRRLYPHRRPEPRAAPDPERWLDDYEKILVEAAVTAEPELPATVLRLPAVYGPGDPRHRLFPYLRRMDDGRPVIPADAGFAGWRWTRGYVENVAAAVALAAADDGAPGRTYNVGEEGAPTTLEWIRAVGRVAGWSGAVVPVPPELLPEPLRRGQDLVVDTSRIRRELGYREPVTPEEALRRTVVWEREHPPEGRDPRRFDFEAEDAALRALGYGGA